jgi:hypothetical protein
MSDHQGEELGAKHCREIEAAIENAKAKGKLSTSISTSEILAALNRAYVGFQIAESLDLKITAVRNDQWERIADMCDELALELDRVDFLPAPPITAPVENIGVRQGNRWPNTKRGVKSTRKTAASLAQELRGIGAGYRCYIRPHAKAVAARRGGANQARENFFQAVIGVWEAFGGARVVPARTETGGPMAHFIITVLRPIFGDDTPAVSSLAAIVKRGRQPVASAKKTDLSADGQ